MNKARARSWPRGGGGTGHIRALGIVGTASETGRTRALIEAVLAGAADASAGTEVVVLGDYSIAVADGTLAEEQTADTRVVLDAIEQAHVVALGTPIYRASFSGILKNFLDLVPRGAWGDAAQPLRAKPVVIAATAATSHHFLALQPLVAMLNGFFAAYVIPPGIYATHKDFDQDGRLTDPVRHQAAIAGHGLVEMYQALARSSILRAVQPQI